MAASLAMMKIPKITTDQNYCSFVVVVIPRLSPPLGSPVNMDIDIYLECMNSSKNLACLHDNPKRNRFAVT